jgi:sugar phosphate isomerase/epimerase
LRSNIFVSTGAFKTRELSSILDICLEYDITNLELSSNVSRASYSLDALLAVRDRMRFLVHNYFPPEDTGLVLNLASGSDQIRGATLAFCKTAIDLCVRLGSPVYTVHSGFCYDPLPSQLGGHQSDLPRHPRRVAQEWFVEALGELRDYASASDVRLCIENNVVPAFNLVEGKNEIDLMSSTADFRDLIGNAALEDVSFLIDLGHLNVSATSERFDKMEFIDTVAPRTEVLHVSDNDGETDQHLPFGQDAWFIDTLSRFSDKLISIESYNLEPEQVVQCIEVVDGAIAGDRA